MTVEVQIIVVLVSILLIFLIAGYPMVVPMLVAPMVIMAVYLPTLDPLMIIQQLYTGVQSYSLLAVPMYMLAADIMCQGKAAEFLIDIMKSFLGHIHGGLAIAASATCTFFGAISGSCQATLVAVGGPMRPQMLKSGYKDRDIVALMMNSANIALLIPPSCLMILFATTAGTSVADLFIAGVLPGLVLFFMFAVYSYVLARKNKTPVQPRASWKQRLHACRRGIFALGFPVIVLGGIYAGIFSVIESAAVGVAYALIVERCIYKSITLKDFYRIARNTGVVTAAIFVLIAAGSAFSFVMTYASVPQTIMQLLLGSNPSKFKMLLVITIVFWVANMLMDGMVSILILVPIFFETAVSLGIDPIQIGIIVTMQGAIGGITPPFGCNIFTACAIYRKSYIDCIRGLPPYIVMMLLVSLMLIVFPGLSTFLLG